MSALKKSQHLSLQFKDIQVATKNFETCIGKGGYGRVYKGQLVIAGKLTTVAVKRLNVQFGQGLKEFLTEIELLSGQQHPNLVSLLGYCDEGNEKIIVYEYAERGSLERYIRHSANNTYTLTWLERLKICIDAARGLDHLHSHVGKHQCIIHRDIKSANILLDENWVAKISDLGLSKLSLAGLDRSAVISHACGTPGYCEPEYIISGIVTKKSDVYSFGMVLFEVLSGKLCSVRDADGFLLSSKSAKEYYRNQKLDVIIDPSLREQISSYSMSKFSAIAYTCLHDDREQRPTMDVVKKELEETLRIQVSSTTDNCQLTLSNFRINNNQPGSPSVLEDDDHASKFIHYLQTQSKSDAATVKHDIIDIEAKLPFAELSLQSSHASFKPNAIIAAAATTKDVGSSGKEVCGNQTLQRVRKYVKVYKHGSLGKAIDVRRLIGYEELRHKLALMFGIEGKLEDAQGMEWKLFYVDHDNDVLIVGDDPWEEFVKCVKSIRILSYSEVQKMSLELNGDFDMNL